MLGRALPWIVALVPFFILVVWFWESGGSIRLGDSAHYLLHARALAEGRPYGDTGYIFTDLNPFFSPRVQPPVLPALLALVMKLFGGFNLAATRIVMLATGLPFFVAGGMYFARSDGRRLGLAVTLWLGLAPGLAMWSPLVQTDLGFCSIVWLVLLLLDRDGPLSRRRVALVFLLGLAAMGYRQVGLALIPTVGLYAAVNYRRLGIAPALPVVGWIAVAVTVATVGGLWDGVMRQVSFDPSELFAIIRYQTYRYTHYLRLTASEVFPRLPQLWQAVYVGAFHLLMIIGFVSWFKRSWRTAGAAFVCCYLATLLVVMAGAPRYLWPLYPIVVFSVLKGIAVVWRALVGRLMTSGRAVGFALPAATAAAVLLSMVAAARTPHPGGVLDHPDVQAVFSFLQEEARTRPVTPMFYKPRLFSWTTRLSAMPFVRVSPDRVVASLDENGITHVVTGSLGFKPGRTAAVEAAVATFGCRFERVFSNEGFVVYRVLEQCLIPGAAGTSIDVGAVRTE